MEQTKSSAVQSPYNGLLYSVFQQPREHEEKGIVIALTSSVAGEGVTYLATQLADQLTTRSRGNVLHVNLSKLSSGGTLTPQVSGPGIAKAPLQSSTISADEWSGSWQYRRDTISTWRSQYEYVLVDCPDIASGSEAIAIAQHVDGILLVVEANKTKKRQLEYAERQLQLAGGKVLGYVLNKRRYLVPEWLYRHL